MSTPDQTAIIEALLDKYGQTFSEELNLGAERDTPSGLFQLLCFALLSSTRISHELAKAAMTALQEHDWRTPQKMADATWQERTDVLNASGYARYDESTSRYLEDTATHLLEAYDGDLRKLREAADHDPREERRRLKEFKGIGDAGADIFQREVQVVWKEMGPFADKKALQAAEHLGLPTDAEQLSESVGDGKQLPKLVAALVRCGLEDGYEEIQAAAR